MLVIHRNCGVLSAHGIGLANIVQEKQIVYKDSLNKLTKEILTSKFDKLISDNLSNGKNKVNFLIKRIQNQ